MKHTMLVALAATVLSCSGSTGGDTFSFAAGARGVAGAAAFETPTGWHVQLTRATFRLGPVYVNHAIPISEGRSTGGYSSGRYIAEVLTQSTVNALDESFVPFAASGTAVRDVAQTGEVWLATAAESPTTLELEGTATRGAVTVPFAGNIRLDESWVAPPDAAMPGASPLSSVRQVTDIPVSFTTQTGGTLEVRIDPSHLFDAVHDFSTLDDNGKDGAGRSRLGTDGLGSDATTVAIFRGLRAHEGVFSLVWRMP